ncbi:MAG: SEC-C domain-containing protein, partial [Acidobacteria bacterium]|nr:SEC-C domain-containing protein [Acidobacteriota bacterium]
FWDDFFEISGRELFPIAIWLLLGLRYVIWRQAPRAHSRLDVDLDIPRQRGRHKPGRGSAGRNAPCPCGSGRKYKRCCAKN